MPRGIPAKTKREKIESRLRLRWSTKRIAKTVGCSVPYVYMIKKEIDENERLVAMVKKLMDRPTPWESKKRA